VPDAAEPFFGLAARPNHRGMTAGALLQKEYSFLGGNEIVS
jgi:hypothetical protein